MATIYCDCGCYFRDVKMDGTERVLPTCVRCSAVYRVTASDEIVCESMGLWVNTGLGGYRLAFLRCPHCCRDEHVLDDVASNHESLRCGGCGRSFAFRPGVKPQLRDWTKPHESNGGLVTKPWKPVRMNEQDLPPVVTTERLGPPMLSHSRLVDEAFATMCEDGAKAVRESTDRPLKKFAKTETCYDSLPPEHPQCRCTVGSEGVEGVAKAVGERVKETERLLNGHLRLPEPERERCRWSEPTPVDEKLVPPVDIVPIWKAHVERYAWYHDETADYADILRPLEVAMVRQAQRTLTEIPVCNVTGQPVNVVAHVLSPTLGGEKWLTAMLFCPHCSM